MKQAKAFSCPQCGSRYSVGHLRSDEAQRDEARYYICDKVLAAFSYFSVPVFWLAFAAPWPWAPNSS